MDWGVGDHTADQGCVWPFVVGQQPQRTTNILQILCRNRTGRNQNTLSVTFRKTTVAFRRQKTVAELQLETHK